MILAFVDLKKNSKNVAGFRALSSSVWGGEKTQYFDSLTPDKVLDAIEAHGFKTTGRVMALASMENRVFEVEVDLPSDMIENVSDNFRILKFYRPGRWSLGQIQDEHDFIFDLAQNEIPAIAPLKIEGQSVFENTEGLYFAIFPKKGGRACDEWTDDLLSQMGRLLARMHATGRNRKSEHRLELNIETFGYNNLELILKSKYMLPEYKESYKLVCEELLQISKPLFKGIKTQRIHGDCHHGNILLGDNRPFVIDFDDMSIGPCVQDIWMITPGRDEYSIRQRDILIDAYLEMSDFDFNELRLIETLRSLRIIHFSAWIAHRFEDQSFKNAFATFGTSQYWEREIFVLREQIGLIKDDLNKSSIFH